MKNLRLMVLVLLGNFLMLPLHLNGQPGSLDLTFNPGSGPNGLVRAVAAQPDGKVLILGDFTKVNGVATQNGIARLNSDGSVDSSFDTGSGLAGNGSQKLWCMALLPNGKILVGGSFDMINGLNYNCIARLREDGSVDTTYKSEAGLGNLLTILKCVAAHTNGQILVGGALPSVSRNVARLNFDGSMDISFTNRGSPYVNSVAVQADGKVIVGGDFSSINDASVKLARLNNDGSLDTNFNCVVAGTPNAICIQQDGKIVVGGSFVSVNGYGRKGIARLNPDGAVDTTFIPGEVASSLAVNTLAIQGDGKIIVGGISENSWVSRCFRLNTNGGLDASFGASPSNSVWSVALQIDGKPLIAGQFTKVGGTSINYIARLNSDAAPTNNLHFLAANHYFGTYLQGTVSNTYRLEYTSKLDTPNLWTPLFNVTLQTNPQFILDPTPVEGQRYYRALQISP